MCTGNKCQVRQPCMVPGSGHFSQRGASLAPQKALATESLRMSRRPPSAPAVRGARQARQQHPAMQTGLTAPEIPDCFPPAASLEEILCIWKPLLIYLPAGNNVAWFPGLQWNEANLSSHPVCKIYLRFEKEKLCWRKTPAPSNFFQKTIQFSLLIDDHNPEPGTFLFPTLCYNEVLMQLMLQHMGFKQPSKKQNSCEWRGGHLYRTTNK